jgi:hypothetical protein
MAEAKKDERDVATPHHPEVLPPSYYGQLDPVESAKMRARIESTPGGARYEEEAAKKADPNDPGPQAGKGRDEHLKDDRKRFTVEAEDKWHFDGHGPLKKGDTILLNDEQARRAGKNVRPA